MWGRLGLFALLALGASGCQNNPFAPGSRAAFWRQPQEQPAHVAQLQEMDSRLQNLNANNSELTGMVAQLRQQVRLVEQDRDLLRKQLDESANQLETVLAAKQEAERKIESLQASTRFQGGATITANNSFKQRLASVEVPGLEVRRDGDVIRIAIPADQLFLPGTVQFQPTYQKSLDQVAQTISSTFPRQLVAIEAHTDSTTMAGNVGSLYQLSASQALAVFEYFTKRSRIPERQLFTMAFGPNQPLVSNGTPAGRDRNRRVEIVVYPDTM
jgi:flagellar motor protein MotB